VKSTLHTVKNAQFKRKASVLGLDDKRRQRRRSRGLRSDAAVLDLE
jgi:hypothetical protein